MAVAGAAVAGSVIAGSVVVARSVMANWPVAVGSPAAGSLLAAVVRGSAMEVVGSAVASPAIGATAWFDSSASAGAELSVAAEVVAVIGGRPEASSSVIAGRMTSRPIAVSQAMIKPTT